MFDVDVTTCVALFLTNILHLKPYVKKSQSQNCQESLVFATVLFYSTVKILIVSVTSEKIQYFFTVEKYQFYSHLICIGFTACDKINDIIALSDLMSSDNKKDFTNFVKFGQMLKLVNSYFKCLNSFISKPQYLGIFLLILTVLICHSSTQLCTEFETHI